MKFDFSIPSSSKHYAPPFIHSKVTLSCEAKSAATCCCYVHTLGLPRHVPKLSNTTSHHYSSWIIQRIQHIQALV